MSSRPGLLLCLCATALSAQTAQISGRVVDPKGDAVPGARVQVTETGASQRRIVTTDERGLYAVPLLKPSNYDLTVEKPGFDSIERSGLRLEVNEVARLDFTLNIVGIHEEVTVESGAHSLDRETPSLGQVVHSGQITELPLLGRNTYALGMLVRGVRTALGMNNLVTDPGSTSAVSINGGRNNMNSFLLHCAPNTSALQNQPIILPSVDSTQRNSRSTRTVSAQSMAEQQAACLMSSRSPEPIRSTSRLMSFCATMP